MNLLERSQLINNISKLNIDNRISKLEVSIKGISNKFGQRLSSSPGQSAVIIDRRHYVQGDLIKDIDWKLSAKTDKLYTKIRESYKQSRVYICVDNSKSMKVKYNKNLSKLDMALLITYIYSRILIKERDELNIYYNGIFNRIKNLSELTEILLDIENNKDNDKNNIFHEKFNLKKSYFLLFSDFFSNINLINAFFKNISNTKIIACIIKDIYEEKLFLKGRYKFINPEDQSKAIATDTKYIYTNYIKDYNLHFNNLYKDFNKLNLIYYNLLNTKDPVNEFLRINE